jgi:HNH endonuclease
MITQITDALLDRFWDKVSIPPNVLTGCWEWKAARSSRGYGAFGTNREKENAHRFAFRMVNGPLRDGDVVMHVCDNRGCVNPTHLRRGTQAENMADMVAKGRQAMGSRRSKKLDESKVREMRALYAGGALQKDLAAKYGISAPTVSGIVSGPHWRHVK